MPFVSHTSRLLGGLFTLSVLALSSCAGPSGGEGNPFFAPPEETPGTVRLGQLDTPPATAEPQPVPRPADAVQRYRSEPRLPISPFGVCEPAPGVAIAVPMPDPRHFPDEYLCDGGDRGYPVHYDQYNRLGLETEDTVAEFVDHTGDYRVRASNKVCIYAPRFAAMRTLDTPAAETGFYGVASADHAAGTGRLVNQAGLDVARRDTPGASLRMRSRASGVDVPVADGRIAQRDHTGEFARYRSGHQEVQFIRTGILDRADEAWLAKRVQAAAVWTRSEFPLVSGRTQGAQEVIARFQPEEMIGIDADFAPGELRIVKMANRSEARPGDVVTFTLRYDNLGPRELYHVRIVDNLTPRLELVLESETSDRPGVVKFEDNQEGSLVLTFELDGPLPPKTGGVITFQARVR